MTFNISTLTSEQRTSIFAQDPKTGFFPILLRNIGIPSEGRVTLDLAQTEDVEQAWDVTRNPVERVVAQNKIRQPKQLSLTGMLSATPLLSPFQFLALVRFDKRELQKLRDILNRALCFVVTPEGMYPNMTCTSLRERYDDTTGLGVALTMTFVEMQIIAPGLVESALDLSQLEVGAAGPIDYGPVTSPSVPDPGGLG